MGFNKKDVGYTPRVYWDDLPPRDVVIDPAGAAAPPTLSADGIKQYPNGVLTVEVYKFQLPHNWYYNTFNFHMHVAKSTAAVGLVDIELKYKIIPIGEAEPAYSTLTPATVFMAFGNTVNEGIIGINITPTATTTLSSIIYVWVERDARVGNAVDTYEGIFKIYDADLHIQKYNDLGSVNEFTR